MSIIDVMGSNFYDYKQIKEINREIEKHIFKKEMPIDGITNANKKGDFYHVHCSPLMEWLYPWLSGCQQINRNIFGYDIYWNFHLEMFNYNVYGIGDEYTWHVDANIENTRTDPKLTCLLNLSEEPYEGGEFYTISDPNKEREFRPGQGLVFTSSIGHKVSPITKGEKKTISYWAYGPSWR